MNLERIRQSLQKIYSEPLPEGADRRIIFWYDAEAAFTELLDQLDLPEVKLWRLTGTNYFATKRLLERDDTHSNFLIYAPFARSAYEDDWLLDILLYSREFSADKASVIMSDFGMHDLALKPLVKQYLSFFDNKERYKKLQAMPHAVWDERNLELGLMAVACKVKVPDFESIVKAVFLAGLSEDENECWIQIGKWPGAERFWHYVEQEYGYKSEEPSLRKLFLTMVITSLVHNLNRELPSDWRAYLSTQKANCVVFIDHWMSNKVEADTFDQLTREFETELKLRDYLNKWSVDEYLECDTFEIFDKAVVLHIINSLLNGSEEYDRLLQMIAIRKTKHWYAGFEKIYATLEAALELFRFKQKYSQGFPARKAGELFLDYAREYYQADYFYRKFYENFDQVVEYEILKKLQPLVENLYDNGILQPLANLWSDQAAEAMSGYWWLSGVNQQRQFYDQYINPIVRRNDKDKVFVIISDALRFEAATELTQRLNQETKGAAVLTPLQGVIPSYTKLGMASLLPGRSVSITEQGKVLVDGMDTEGLAQREKVLQATLPESVAVNLPELLAMSKEEGREFVRPNRVIYIYHDTIDAIGDKSASERHIFEAVSDALLEIERCIRYICNQLNGTTIMVTADHGFLYKRDPLAESDKIDTEKGNAMVANRRFLITQDSQPFTGTLAFNMQYILGNDSKFSVLVPRGAQRFKMAGGGSSYVHGGASLQEIVVPLVQYKNLRLPKSKEASLKVEVKLTNTNRKITNNTFTLDFFQTEKVTEKLGSRRLRVAIWDLDGGEKKVSEEKLLIADKDSDRADERTFKLRITLKGGQYDRNKDYYLCLIDDELGLEYERIPYKINLGIANDFDDF